MQQQLFVPVVFRLNLNHHQSCTCFSTPSPPTTLIARTRAHTRREAHQARLKPEGLGTVEVLKRYEVGVVHAEAAVQDTDNVAGQAKQRRVVLPNPNLHRMALALKMSSLPP